MEADDRVDVLIELRAGAGVCSGCAGVSTSVHERTDVRVRDIPVHGKLTYLVWRKRRFRCEQSECDRATFSEEHSEIPPCARGQRNIHEDLCGGAGPGAASEHLPYQVVEGDRQAERIEEREQRRSGGFLKHLLQVVLELVRLGNPVVELAVQPRAQPAVELGVLLDEDEPEIRCS